MKKSFKFYIIAWIVLLALFNVIAFVSVGWEGIEKYTPSFWIGYGFISFAFIGQLICAYIALNKKNAKDVFYNIPLVKISYGCLIAMFFVGGLCMLISPMYGYIAAIVCAIILVVNILALVKAAAAAEIISTKDEEIKENSFFVKSLAIDANSLIAKASTPDTKEACRKVFEAVRYADPISNAELADVENRISAKFDELTAAVTNGSENIGNIAEEFVALVGERNQKCKLLK